MKTIKNLLLAVLITSGLLHTAESATISFSQTFSASDFSSLPVLNGNTAYHRLAVKGCLPFNGLPGSPAVPVKYVNILVPFNAKITGLNVTGSTATVLTGSFNPLPVQSQVPLNGQAAPEFVAADPLFYQAKGDYPGKLARIKGAAAWGEHQIATVEIMPLQYNSSLSRLTLYTSVSFEIEYVLKNNAVIPVKRRSPLAQSLVENQVKTAIANKTDFARLAVPPKIIINEALAKSPASESPSPVGSPVDYVIITSEELAPYFRKLADWKNQKGIYTAVKTTSWIAANYRGSDLQEKIRHFIQDAWTNWGTVMVLLGGDTSVIPVRYIIWLTYPQYIPDLRIPSDLYYSDIADTSSTGGSYHYDFDSNHDGQYGDVLGGDVIDLQADLLLGRAPVTTAEQAQTFVDKVLAYEKNPPSGFGSSFLMLADGGFAWSPESVNDSPLKIDAPWIDSYELYRPAADSVSFTWAGDKDLYTGSALAELNKGYNLIYHFDHGGHYQLGAGVTSGGGWLYRPDADRLLNIGRSSVVITPACDANSFDYDCFAEHLLNNPKGGAVSFIGNSRIGWGYQGYLCQEFFTAIFHNRQLMLGQAFAAMHHYHDTYSLFSMNLMGDPSMQVWSAEPRSITVGHPSRLTVADSLITVDIDGPASGGPVQVTVYKQNEILSRASASVPSSVTLPASALTEGQILVTVTGPNTIPSQTSCHVVSSVAAHPCISRYFIRDDGRTASDPSNGNCDQIMNPGETIAVYPAITNNGLSLMTASCMIMRSPDSLVQVTDPIIELPALGPGQTLVCDTILGPCFLISVSPRIRSDRPLQLTVFFAAKPDTSKCNLKTTALIGSQDIKTTVKTDSLVVASYRMSVSPRRGGSNKGLLAVLDSVVIVNLGTGQARGISLTVAAVSGNQDESPVAALGFGNIAPGAAGTCQNHLIKQLRTDTHDPFPLLLTIKDAYGREQKQVIRWSQVNNPVWGLQTKSLGPDRNQIKWIQLAEDAGIKGYNLYRKTLGQRSFSKINLVPVEATRCYVDQGLAANQSYIYTVSAVDTFGCESPLFPRPDTVKTQPASMPGFPVTLGVGAWGTRMWASPAAGDINNDGFEEIILGSDDGQVYAYDHQGGILSGWPVEIGGSIDQSSPALADIDGDGFMETVMGSGGWSTVPGDRQVHVFRYDGTEQPGWPKAVSGDAFAGAVVADLNYDDRYEVVAATTGGYIYVWDAQGNLLPGWPLYAGGPVWSAPAVGNLDADAQREIAVTSNCAGALRLLILNHDGTDLPGWPQIIQPSAGYAMASPVLADMDGDGKNEIILGAETYSPNLATKCYAFRADGSQLAGWPVGFASGTRVVCSPAIADLDKDGKLDAAFIASNGLLRAYSVNRMLWEVQTGSNGRTNPIAADIDSDGITEILLTTESGYLYSFEGTNGSLTPGYPIWMEPSWSAPVLSDIDRNGKMDLLAFGWGSHKLYAWELEAGAISSTAGCQVFRVNMCRTGCVNDTVAANKSGLMQSDLTGPVLPVSTLGQNYPNPVKQQTTINFQTSRPGQVKLNVYNLTGQLVKTIIDDNLSPGDHRVKWDGKNDQGHNIASGTYIYRLETPGFNSTKKMLVLR